MSPLFELNRLLCVKVGTEGSWDASTLDDANVIQVQDLRRPDIDVTKHDRMIVHGYLGSNRTVKGARIGKLSFKTDLVGATSGGVAPFWGKLIRACGWIEAINSGSADYTQDTSDPANITPDSTHNLTIGGTFSGAKAGRYRLVLISSTTGPNTLTFRWQFRAADGSAYREGTTVHTDTSTQTIEDGLTLATSDEYGANFDDWNDGDVWYFDVTPAAAASVRYRTTGLNAGAIPCLNMAVVDNPSRYFALHSARGTCKITFSDVGAHGMLEFEFTGVIEEIAANTTSFTAFNFLDVLPPQFMATDITMFSGTLAVPAASMEFDCGNTVVAEKDHREDSGFRAAQITNRAMTGQIRMEAAALATNNVFDKLIAGTIGTFSCTLPSPTAGNNITLSARNMEIISVPDEADEGILMDPINVEFHKPEADGAGEFHEFEINLT